MTVDVAIGIVVFLGLLAFYWWNEPKARERDRARQEHEHQEHERSERQRQHREGNTTPRP